MSITLENFYDPDIPDTTEKYDAVDKYEYAITDNSWMGNIYTNWTAVTVPAGDIVSQISPLHYFKRKLVHVVRLFFFSEINSLDSN